MTRDRRPQTSRFPYSRLVARLFIASVLFVGWAALPACSKKDAGAPAAAKTVYHCPMHPQYTSDKPGDCPICHMRLVPVAPEPAAKPERKILHYRNPMDPGVTSPTPAKDAMGMDYVPVYADDAPGASAIPGQGNVRIPDGREQAIGVKVSTVAVRDLHARIRASARVAYDPGLYSAILEHQQSVSARERMDQAGAEAFGAEAEATVNASRLRLRQLGLSDDQIDRLGDPNVNPSNLLLGKAGGTVWVYAELYDYEAGAVRPGQTVELASPAFPGRTFPGKVKALDPVLNSETRTLRARIEAPNPKGELKPEMYLTAVIYSSLGKALAVPDSAVMDTGTRRLVFVEQAPGRYDPREVRLGREADGYYEVLEGLKEGERVVTSANFLIDSESKIRAAAAGQ